MTMGWVLSTLRSLRGQDMAYLSRADVVHEWQYSSYSSQEAGDNQKRH